MTGLVELPADRRTSNGSSAQDWGSGQDSKNLRAAQE